MTRRPGRIPLPPEPVRTGFRKLLPVLLALGFLLIAGCSAQRVNAPELRKANAEKELEVIRALPAAPAQPITLQQAIDFALANNMETKVREIEQAVQEEFLTGKKMEMLPNLLAHASLSVKSQNPAIRAEDADTGKETLPPSIMTNQFTDRSRVYLTWDLLDFGVTYFRSRQALNRLTIMEEQTRRARQQMVREVTGAYGRLLVARTALDSARELLADHNARLNVSRGADPNDSAAQSRGLELEIDSLESIERISRHEKAMNAAQADLVRLMGLAPGSRVTPVAMDTSTLPPTLDVRLDAWDREAVLNRPELSEKDIMEKITDDEANIALAQMFPNPGLLMGFQREGNTFLTVNDWFSVGLTVSWNLLSIPKRLSEKRQAELEGQVIALKRVALTMAVMAQVHMSALEYQDSIRRYLLKEDIAARRQRLVERLAMGNDPDRLLEERTKAYAARVEALGAYMEILEARETVFASLGRDPYEDRGYASIQPSPLALDVPGSRTLSPVPGAQSADRTEHAVTAIEERILDEVPAPVSPSEPGPDAPEAAAPKPDGPPASTPVEKTVSLRTEPVAPSGIAAGDPLPPVRIERPDPAPEAPAFSAPAVAAPKPLQLAAATPVPRIPVPEIRIRLVPGGGTERVRIDSNAPLTVENCVHLSDPDRLVVNLAGTGAYQGPSRMQGRGDILGLRVRRTSGGIRLILELAPGTPDMPKFAPDASGLSIALGRAG